MKVLFFTVCLFSPLVTNAQQNETPFYVSFSYDNGGNRNLKTFIKETKVLDDENKQKENPPEKASTSKNLYSIVMCIDQEGQILNFYVKRYYGDFTVKMYSVSGAYIKTFNFKNGRGIIDMYPFNNGLYLLDVKVGEYSEIFKYLWNK